MCVQVKVVDVEREQKVREVAELQTRLSLELQKEEERGKELFSIKQKLTEAEAARNSLRKEVQRENTHAHIFTKFSICSWSPQLCISNKCVFLRRILSPQQTRTEKVFDVPHAHLQR